MADIRIKDLATTATTTASDDFMAVDGTTNGTRKMNAAAPAFLTSVTTPSLTSPAATNLTLGLGTGGTALTLTSSTLAATFAGAASFAGNVAVTNTNLTGAALSARYNASNQRLGFNIQNSNGPAVLAWNAASIAGFDTLNYDLSQAAGKIALNASNGVMALSVAASGTAGNAITFTDALSLSTTAATFAGAVTISSSTAGSAGAGALVVTGGLSAGNNGNASYFGGAVTATGSTSPQLIATESGALLYAAVQLQATSAGGKLWTIASNATGSPLGTAGGLSFRDSSIGTTYLNLTTTGLAITGTLSTTGAATFAGAVTAASLATAQTATAATSIVITHKIPIVLNSVTYYMALTATP